MGYFNFFLSVFNFDSLIYFLCFQVRGYKRILNWAEGVAAAGGGAKNVLRREERTLLKGVAGVLEEGIGTFK